MVPSLPFGSAARWPFAPPATRNPKKPRMPLTSLRHHVSHRRRHSLSSSRWLSGASSIPTRSSRRPVQDGVLDLTTRRPLRLSARHQVRDLASGACWRDIAPAADSGRALAPPRRSWRGREELPATRAEPSLADSQARRPDERASAHDRRINTLESTSPCRRRERGLDLPAALFRRSDAPDRASAELGPAHRAARRSPRSPSIAQGHRPLLLAERR